MKRVISGQLPPETELPLGQLDSGVYHEHFHTVHHQRLQNLSKVVQETQRPVQGGYPQIISPKFQVLSND